MTEVGEGLSEFKVDNRVTANGIGPVWILLA
ncbi:MAG: hypothetical protein VB018_12115 [Lachnospiraceae bacterium]|nr:hypothetical protein [Lachnospiraceae bacterium]